MRQSGGCKISAAKKQSRRRSKKARWEATLRPSQLPSAVRPAPNSGRHGSRQSMEPKAVLEHRAPKASTPILHSRGVESKVGRVPHVRDAPVWVVLTRLLGRNPPVRALTSAATFTCSAVAAVCDHEVFLVAHLRECVAAPMLRKNGRRSQNAATNAV